MPSARRWLLVGLVAVGLAQARAEEDATPAGEIGLDAELGLQLVAPRNWTFERAGGAGERLRAVRRDGRAWCSLVVREAPPGQTALERVRAALAPELPIGATLVESAAGRFEIEATRRADLVRRLVRIRATAWLDGDRVVLVRAGSLDEGADAAQVRSDADTARRSVQACPDDAARTDPSRSRCVLDRTSRVALVAARTDDVRREPGARPLELRGADGARVEVRILEGEPVAALARALEMDERAVAKVASSDFSLVKVRLDRTRAVAFETSKGTVVAIARGDDATVLRRAAGAVIVADPARMAELAARASEAARELARARDARAELRHDEAVARVGSALALFPDDADALELRAALLRDEGGRAIGAVDLAWQAYAAPWTAEVMAKIHLEDALAAEGARKIALAAFRYAHSLELDRSPEAVARAERFFSARDAFESAWEALPGLLRVRELVPESVPLKKAEAELHLRVAEQCLEEGRYQRARDEARKAAKLGGDARRVEAADKRAQLGERGKLKKPTRPQADPIEDEEKPRRRDRREIAPVAGHRPIG